MAKKKYYAVAKGYIPGIYTTWDHCKAQVKGYSKAIYKSFNTIEDAEEFLLDNGVGVKSSKTKKNKQKDNSSQAINIEKIPYSQKTDKGAIRSNADVKVLKDYLDPEMILNLNPNAFIAFVDGSYDKDTKIYGSGVAILLPNGKYEGLVTAGIDEWDQWNIVGELEATKLAIQTAEERGENQIFIYHDLNNISLWASGEWQAKNEYTQEYVRFIEEKSKTMQIQFIKVKGHSGNTHNDAADKLAELAVAEHKKDMLYQQLDLN